MLKIGFALAALSGLPSSMQTPVTGILSPAIQIDGQDGTWHDLSPGLVPGHWYALTVRSTVIASASETAPSQLHLDIDHGPYGRHSFRGDGGATIQRVIYLDATSAALRVRLHDTYYADNSGSVGIRVREISQ